MSDPSGFDHSGSSTPSAMPSGFRAAITSALSGMGYSVVRWEPDGVNVIAPDKDGEQFIGLSNLHRRAKGADIAEWPHMIREFLGHVTGAITGTEIPEDLTTVTSRLRPRVGKPFTLEGKAHPWGIPLAGTDLEINLVIDFPNTMAYVTTTCSQRPASPGDMLALALSNLRADPAGFLRQGL